MIRVRWAVAAVVLLAACRTDQAANIAELRNAWAAAWKTGNAAQLAALYGANAIEMPNRESTVHGAIAIASAYGGEFARFTPNDIVMNSEKTVVSGNLAYDMGTFQVSLTPRNGAPTSDSGRYLIILERQSDGGWKIVASMFNSPTPGQPVAPLAVPPSSPPSSTPK